MDQLAGEKRFLTFKGVGKGIFNDLSGNRVADVVKATEVKLAWEVKTKDMMGGDAVFPFGTMVTDAEGSVEITEGTFDMGIMQAQMNNAVQYGVAATVWEIDEQATIPSTSTYTVALAFAATQTGIPVVRYLDGSGALTKVASAPTVGQFSVAVGVLTFNVADAGKALTVDYQRTVASADIASATSDPGILYGTYIHTVKYMNPITAAEGLGQLVVYRCSYNGKNELGFKRGDSAQPKISLKVFDPGRPDKKVFDLIRMS